MEKRVNWKDNVQLLRKYIEEDGLTRNEVAKIFNCSPDRVSEAFKRYNIKYDGKGIHIKPNSWTKEEVDLVRKLLNKRMTYTEMAEYFPNRTKDGIRNLVKEHGKEFNLINPVKEEERENVKKAKDSQEIIEELSQLGYNNKEISEKLGIKQDTIKRALTNVKRPHYTKLEKRGIFRTFNGLKITDLTEDKLISLLKSGKSREDIAKEYNLYPSRVSEYAARIGYPDETKLRALNLKKEYLKKFMGIENPTNEDLRLRFDEIIPKEEIESLLKETGYSIDSTSELLGVDRKIVDTIIKRENIEFPELHGFRSIGEYYVHKMLTTIKGISNLNHDTSFDCHNSNIDRNWILIDFTFYYKGEEIWIEYNGSQHYKFLNSSWFGRTLEGFKSQVKRDLYVKSLSKKKKTRFIEIPYTFNTYDKIQDLLQRVIINGEDINNIIDYTPFYKEIRELGISIDEN